MASKDYIFKMLAASSHSKDAREEHDFYSTEPKAVEDLLRYVDLQHKVTEPSCGNGNIANVLLSHGHEVDAYDLIDRGFGYTKDFLSDNTQIDGDIVMNPPYAIQVRYGTCVTWYEYFKRGWKVMCFS